MTGTTLSPNLTSLTANELKPGQWAFLPPEEARGLLDGGLVLVLDHENDKNFYWVLYFGENNVGFSRALFGNETVARVDGDVRVVLPVALEERTAPKRTLPVQNNTLKVGSNELGALFLATNFDNEMPMWAPTSGSSLKGGADPQGACLWDSGRLEYRDEGETEWKHLWTLDY